MVLLLHYTYSVPVRTSDRQKLDGESEEDYPFIIAAVCPMKTETGTLGFDEEEGVLKKNRGRNGSRAGNDHTYGKRRSIR